MVTLADSGATGCLMAQDMAERLGLHIRPWEHGNEGFTCANGGIIGINGTATLPFSIQRFKGSAHVHVVDKLPGGVDLILGSDWMREEKAILDYDDMRLILKRHGFDPVISGRKAAKFLKAGANHIMVNIRDSRPVDYPASNVSATESADLLAKVLPSSVPLPNPREVEVDFETWVRENCPEHGDPALMPTHVVRHLLHKFKKVFNALPMQTPKHRDIPHVIKTEENAYAPYRRSRRMSPAETALCEEYVAGLLKHGFITPSSSPYGAPIMIIAKASGVGYRVIRISDEDAPKTAFTTPMGQYEFKVLGMGLANAPATFQAVMNKKIAPFLHKFVVVYLDDILVYGRNPEEYAANLEKVLQVLQDEEFYAKLSKCTFNQSEVKFLGHIIGRDGVKVNPKKVATVRDWPTPRHAKHVQQFLGLTNYFRKFIQGYSSMAAPLSDLTKLKGNFGDKWTTAHSSAFEGLKTALTSAPVLMLPDFDKPFEVISDASLLGKGAVLLQDKHPVAYSSKKYIPAEKNYTVSEQEMLDLITALPPTTSGHDAIAVFVDKLSKMVHVAPCSTTVSAVGFAAIYLDTVVRHHGIPKKLLSDRDARDCLKAAQSRQKANYDKRRREVTFSVGEQVLLSTRNMKFKATGKPKFVPRWVGPHTISGVVGPRDEVTQDVRQVTACRLDLPKMMKLHPVFHVGLLKPWHSDGQPHLGQPLEFDTDGSPTWTAACIMRQKSRVIKISSKRRVEYLIRWAGYGIEQDTWESAKDIDKKSPQIVTAWLQRSQRDRDYRTGSRTKRKNPSA
eukprot:gene6677-biopygen1870